LRQGKSREQGRRQDPREAEAGVETGKRSDKSVEAPGLVQFPKTTGTFNVQKEEASQGRLRKCRGRNRQKGGGAIKRMGERKGGCLLRRPLAQGRPRTENQDDDCQANRKEEEQERETRQTGTEEAWGNSLKRQGGPGLCKKRSRKKKNRRRLSSHKKEDEGNNNHGV